jgi:hypothetical protein
MTALIAVFSHVVCNPSSESASNDIALMEVVIGHLGRLEFITSGGTAFNKIGELVRLARRVVHESRQSSDQGLVFLYSYFDSWLTIPLSRASSAFRNSTAKSRFNKKHCV